jgi:hypothetical protein
MKNYIFYISFLCLLFFVGCREEEILTSKPGESIAPVTNLQHTISGNSATLTWKLPATFPADIIQPVSVLVIKTEDERSAGTEVLADAPESLTLPYDPAKKYKFTVKVQGVVNSTDPNVSKLRLSLGQTVAF